MSFLVACNICTFIYLLYINKKTGRGSWRLRSKKRNQDMYIIDDDDDDNYH